MILLIDNYDSFSFNLYQMIGSIEPEIMVIRNDDKTVSQIRELSPAGIVISPGPGRPEHAGVCADVVRGLGADIPVLGVCLGHQAICLAYGAEISYASKLMHGKQSVAKLDLASPLFAGCKLHTPVARYHSLAVVESTLPENLTVTARSDDGEIMAVCHQDHPVFGLQFHPESIMTPEGKVMLGNFIRIAERTKI